MEKYCDTSGQSFVRKSIILLGKEIRFVPQRVALIRKRRVAFKSRQAELLSSLL